jgi:hypothetical protein
MKAMAVAAEAAVETWDTMGQTVEAEDYRRRFPEDKLCISMGRVTVVVALAEAAAPASADLRE